MWDWSSVCNHFIPRSTGQRQLNDYLTASFVPSKQLCTTLVFLSATNPEKKTQNRSSHRQQINMQSVMSMIRCEGFTRPGQVKSYQLTARKVVFDDIPINWATTERWTCWIFFSDCFLSWLFLNSLFSVYVFTWVSVQICTGGPGSSQVSSSTTVLHFFPHGASISYWTWSWSAGLACQT